MKFNEQLTKNFTYGEFWSNSKDGIKVEPPRELFDSILTLATELQVVRDLLKKPIIVNSGYRTSEWNKYIGGAKRSYHTKGLAVDSKMLEIDLIKYVMYLLKFTKFNGYGIYKKSNFVHSDLRDKFIIFKY